MSCPDLRSRLSTCFSVLPGILISRISCSRRYATRVGTIITGTTDVVLLGLCRLAAYANFRVEVWENQNRVTADLVIDRRSAEILLATPAKMLLHKFNGGTEHQGDSG